MKFRIIFIMCLVSFLLPVFSKNDTATELKKKGVIEIGVHYSYWTIDMISGLIEDLLVPDVENFDEDLGVYNFNSNGNNLGVEIRIFPKGKNGSFSIGLSYERNNFKGVLTGQYTEIQGKETISANMQGDVQLLPHSFNLNLRWDLWPDSKFHPYIGFGFGIGRMNGTISFKGSERITYQDLTFEVEVIDEEYTLKEILEEGDEEIPINFIPIVQFQFGFRFEIVDKIYLLAEAAIYNGLIFRGGLAFRF